MNHPLVPTTRGPMPWSQLVRVMTYRENADAIVVGYEFYFEGEQVHRSAFVQMKRWPAAQSELGSIS